MPSLASGLALWALESGKLRFPVRPKMHSLEHLKLVLLYVFFPKIPKETMIPTFLGFGNLDVRILDFIPHRGNPRFYQCMLDEDMIRRDT